MTGQEILIGVSAFSSWEPEGDSSKNVAWAAGDSAEAFLDKPDLHTIPPMQRRRLSPLARVVFFLLEQCSSSGREEPVVFSSVMGEIQRTQSMLESLGAGQPLSPAAFSLSVHNAIGGLWSLVHGVSAQMLSLAPPAGSPMPALFEALGMLEEGIASGVLVCFYEEDFPEFYSPFLKGPEAPTGLAMRVVTPVAAQRDGGIVLSLSPDGASAGESGHISLLRLLHAAKGEVIIAEPHCSWRARVVP